MADFTRIAFRRDTAANWESVNPVLEEGEMGIVSETLADGSEQVLFKIGDNKRRWKDLPYASGPAGKAGDTGPIGPTGKDGADGVSVTDVAISEDGRLQITLG